MMELQRLTYEATAFMGPIASALMAGFAAIGLDGEIYRTPDGERYLASLALERAA